MKFTLIYDGACGWCARNVRLLHRLDWRKRMEALPFQSDEVYARFPGLSRPECEKAIHVVLEDGRMESGTNALREVFFRMPMTWVMGIVMAVPPLSWLLGKLYRRVAPWRHHLGGTCPVQRPKAEG